MLHPGVAWVSFAPTCLTSPNAKFPLPVFLWSRDLSKLDLAHSIQAHKDSCLRPPDALTAVPLHMGAGTLLSRIAPCSQLKLLTQHASLACDAA